MSVDNVNTVSQALRGALPANQTLFKCEIVNLYKRKCRLKSHYFSADSFIFNTSNA